MTMKDDQDFEDSVGIEWFMRAPESIGKDFAATDNPIFYLIIIRTLSLSDSLYALTIPLSLLLAQVSQTERKCMHMCNETRQWIWWRPSHCIRRVTAEMEFSFLLLCFEICSG